LLIASVCVTSDDPFYKNSANIIVQNRLTGQLEEEKMQVYVRLGIRLLYTGASGRMEGARGKYYVAVFWVRIILNDLHSPSSAQIHVNQAGCRV